MPLPFALLLMFSLALAAVIWLEVTRPDAPVTAALRKWQTGLGALLGLCGVAYSVSIQAKEADRLERAKLYREGVVIAMSMQQEALRIRRWLYGIEEQLKLVESLSDGKGETDRAAGARANCSIFFALVRNRSYVDTGVIAAHRANVGKLPNLVGLHYVDLHNWHNDLRQQLQITTDKQCSDDPLAQFAIVKEQIGSVKAALDRADEQMSNLPETTSVRVIIN